MWADWRLGWGFRWRGGSCGEERRREGHEGTRGANGGQLSSYVEARVEM